MKHYYIAEDEIQTGPFTYEEILSKKILKSTLIWTEGLDGWKEANQIEELKFVLIAEPPPIPRRTLAIPIKESEEKVAIINVNDEYDNTYEKEANFSIIGIGIAIITLLANYQVRESENTSILPLLILFSFIVRVGVAHNIKKIAIRQNRNSEPWTVFGFLFPALSLIIIGQLKKLKLNIYNSSTILLKRAKTLFEVEKYDECLLILNEILESNQQNSECLKLRSQILFDNKNYEGATKDLEKLVTNNQYLDFAYNSLGEIAIVNRNKEMAISYWIKAKDLYSAEAIKNLNIYKTYEYQYVLSKNQAHQKIQKNINFQSTYFLDGKYIGGFAEIDELENPNFLSTNITLYDMGVFIELSKTLKTFFIAIAYHELTDIIYNQEHKIFTLILDDKKKIAFKYDIEKDNNFGIQKLQTRFYHLMIRNLNDNG